MRIGIDGGCWSNRRGFGRFTRCILAEMVRRRPEHRYMLVIDRPSLETADLPAEIEVVPVELDRPPSEAASADGRRSLPDVLRMTAAARRSRCDAFYFPATYSYFPVVGTPTVVTVHDAIAETRPELVFATWQARVLWQLKQRAALRRATAVVTVSQAARQDIVSRLPIDEDRIVVVREAADPRFRPIPPQRRSASLEGLGLHEGDRYVLYVGGISPHKNLELLVGAFEKVASRHSDVRLLLVGDTTDDPFLSSTGALRRRIETSPAGHRITMTGFVDDDALVALYGGAVATVLPSLGEGFGLTAAESAACGTPVVASRIPALTELLGDAGLYADPSDAAAFATALNRVLEEPELRPQLAGRSLARAASWSWAAAADAVVDTLERAATAPVLASALATSRGWDQRPERPSERGIQDRAHGT